MKLFPKPATNPLYHSRVQQLRVERRLSQRRLAERAGLAIRTTHRIEHRSRTREGHLLGYYPQTAQALATALEVSEQDLFMPAPGGWEVQGKVPADLPPERAATLLAAMCQQVQPPLPVEVSFPNEGQYQVLVYDTPTLGRLRQQLSAHHWVITQVSPVGEHLVEDA